MSNRTSIINALIHNLKRIDGRTSPFDANYEFKSNLNENVFRGLRFIDEVNDFPSVFVTNGIETRTYQTQGLTEAEIQSVARCYAYSDDTKTQLEAIAQDIEHVIYSGTLDIELSVQDITITQIIQDSGLLQPYGIVEIFFSIRFEIFNN